MTGLEVRAVAVSLPLQNPTRISTRSLVAREFVIVTVGSNHSEIEGIGYTYAGTTGGTVVASLVNSLLSGIVAERGSHDIVGTWDAMFQETLLIGRRGAVIRAMSAVDTALWDLAAKRAGVPLAVLLGGSVREVAAYASGGYYRPTAEGWAASVASEIAANREQGFSNHKIKVGGLSVDDDAKRVAAAVEAMEGVGQLALDANNAYSTVAEAQTAAEAFERAAGPTGLWWFEEPLSTEDVNGHRRLRDRIRTPIATGELAQTRHEFRTLLEKDAADVLQPDAGVLGGVTEYMRVARAAETFAVSVAPHWHANLHVHLAAASTGCLTIEHFTLDKDIYNFERLLEPNTRLQVKDGMALVPDRPGLGLEFDQDFLKAHVIGTGAA